LISLPALVTDLHVLPSTALRRSKDPNATELVVTGGLDGACWYVLPFMRHHTGSPVVKHRLVSITSLGGNRSSYWNQSFASIALLTLTAH
jgi:hypothetical protein